MGALCASLSFSLPFQINTQSVLSEDYGTTPTDVTICKPKYPNDERKVSVLGFQLSDSEPQRLFF